MAGLLEGKRILVTGGIITDSSIAFHIAKSPRRPAPNWCSPGSTG